MRITKLTTEYLVEYLVFCAFQVLSFGDSEGPEGVALTMKNTGQLMDVNNEVVNDLSCVVKDYIYNHSYQNNYSYQSNHSYQSKHYANIMK